MFVDSFLFEVRFVPGFLCASNRGIYQVLCNLANTIEEKQYGLVIGFKHRTPLNTTVVPTMERTKPFTNWGVFPVLNRLVSSTMMGASETMKEDSNVNVKDFIHSHACVCLSIILSRNSCRSTCQVCQRSQWSMGSRRTELEPLHPFQIRDEHHSTWHTDWSPYQVVHALHSTHA